MGCTPSTHLLSGDPASSILRTHLATPTPPHPQRVSSGLLHPGSLQSSGVTLKKQQLPTTKQTKGRSGAQLERQGFPWPLSSQSMDNPYPSSAWLQSREYPAPQHPALPAPTEPGAYTAATWVSGPTYCAGQLAGWAGVASPSPTPRTTAPGRPGPGRPASAAGPPPAPGPAVGPSTRGRVAQGGAPTVSFPQKRPGRRTRL